MTVSSSTSQARFTGNGIATSFSLPFRFFNNSEIIAMLIDTGTGTSMPLSIGVDYSLVGAGEPENDGTPASVLTLFSPLEVGFDLLVEREIPVTQPTDIVNQGRFFPQIHENVFDRLTMLIQQAFTGLRGAIRVAIGDPEPKRLPPASQRANLLMSFDGAGDPIAVAPSSGSATDLALILANNSDPSKGGSAVGYKGRTVSQRLSDISSVKDAPFMAAGTGLVNDATAFQAAVNSITSGQAGTFLVPAGDYRLDTNVVQSGRFVTFVLLAGATLSGAGRLETNMVKYDSLGAQYGQGRHGFGSNVEGGGLLVGGGVPDEGGNGVFLANDGHANWLRAITSINYNPTELLIYGASGQGRAISVVGGGFIDRVEGTQFTAEWVGRPFYFNYKKYEVKAFVSVNRLELREVGGAAVVFGSASISAFHFVMTTGSGLCSVSGATLTRVSGQPFVPFITYPGFTFKLNGTTVTVSAFVSPDQITLTAAPGDTASTPYFFELDINGQISTLRVQKQFGTTEENLTLAARANGEYEVRVGQAGNGEYYPLRFYNGQLAAFTPQPVAVVHQNGRLGVSTVQNFVPAARLHVADVRTEALGTNLYNEMARLSTNWAAEVRGFEVGTFSNGTQGGYLQGRDNAGNNYDICLNPRGGNVGVGLNNPVMRMTVAGVVGPAADNTYSLGQSGARWSVLWAAAGTINTSDERTKTDIVGSPLGLDFINTLNPVAYRFKVGGVEVEEVEDGFDEVQRQVVEEFEESAVEPVIKEIDGRKVLINEMVTRQSSRPVFDLIEDVYDEAGNLLPPTRVPRMETVKVPRFTQKQTEVAGKRQHFGLIAQEVKAAIDAAGVDFGGYVEGEDGMLGLRYEQFIAPLIKAVQELSERVRILESK